MLDFFAEEKQFLQKIANRKWLAVLPPVSIILLILAIIFDAENRIAITGSVWAYYVGVGCFFVGIATLALSWGLLITKRNHLKEHEGKYDRYVYIPCWVGQAILAVGFLFLNFNASMRLLTGEWEYLFDVIASFSSIAPLTFAWGFYSAGPGKVTGITAPTVAYLACSVGYFILQCADALAFGFSWTSIFESISVVLYIASCGFLMANLTVIIEETHIEPNAEEIQLEYLRRIDAKTASIDSKIDDISQSIALLTSNILEQKEKFTTDAERLSLTEDQLEVFRTDFVGKMAESVISTIYKETASVDYEESLLKGMFGPYWNMLDSYTQKALISAKVFLKTCSAASHTVLDYSGIIVSASAALENEIKRRLFVGYQLFLRKKLGAPSAGEWPEITTFRQNNGNIVASNTFMLGTVKHLLEVQGKDKQYFEDYLETILSDKYKSQGLSAFVDQNGDFASFKTRCEHVRITHRNAAAHTGWINRSQAEACCNDIIGPDEASQKIGHVQGLLYDLVQMTANFS